MTRAGLALVVVALPACNFSADWGGTTFRCNADRDCPSGFVCEEDMLCHAPGGGDDAGPDDDGGPIDTGPCGTVGVLGDDLDAPDWEQDWGDVPWDLSGGEIRAELMAGVPVQGAFGTVREYYLVDGDALSMRVDGPVAGYDMSVRLVFEIEGENVEVGMTNGDLAVETWDGMDAMNHYTGPYDAADHRYWRLQRMGDDIVASVSPDGALWDDLATVAMEDPAERNLAFVAVYADIQVTLEADVSLAFSQLETAPSRRCLTEDLVDDFEDPGRQRVWESYDGSAGGCTIDEDDGVLRFTAVLSEGECGYRSRIGFDPRDSAFTFEVTEPGAGEAPTLEAALVEVDGDVYDLYLHGDPREVTMQAPGEGPVTVPYQDGFRWARIRGGGDTMFFEVSADGTSWDELAAYDGLILTDDVLAFLDAQGGDGVVSVDNVGLPPE